MHKSVVVFANHAILRTDPNRQRIFNELLADENKPGFQYGRLWNAEEGGVYIHHQPDGYQACELYWSQLLRLEDQSPGGLTAITRRL